MKSIRCPFCMSPCEVGTGYYHDERLNIHCGKCHNVILATSEDDEKELVKLHTRPIKDTHDSVPVSQPWNYGHRGPHNHNYGHQHQHQQQPGQGNPYPGMMGADYDHEYD